MNTIRLNRFISLVVSLFIIFFSSISYAEIKREKFQTQGNYLIVEVLDDDLVHFEYGVGTGPDTDKAIQTTEMICKATDVVPQNLCKTDFNGPTSFSDNGEGVIETKDMRLQIEKDTLFINVIDKTKNDSLLTTISPFNLHLDRKGLLATRTADLDVYGLGQQFVEMGNSNIDWDGRVREGGEFGNVMAGVEGLSTGNTQIPILYAVNGASFDNYALFLDNKYRHEWDFTGESHWKVEMDRGLIRFYLMTGSDLQDLRKDYLELVGRPLVPPKKMFGLWMSEYGYDNWTELDDKLNSLQGNKFPIDGFVLDLQWFGGIKPHSENTSMGKLTFDESSFPDPEGKISNLMEDKGIGIMLIEEAYVGRALSEHGDLHSRGCLVTSSPGGSEACYIDVNPWWGLGGMIDYTNDSCSEYWHDTKRQPLINIGVIGHWTDLGEPEMYRSECGYSTGGHANAHNIFNLGWIRGINNGYTRNSVERRPFIMSRSGAAGIQRYGAAMWSGDIRSQLRALAAHAANQMHMSLSGIDFYGADIGGFHRNLDGDLNEMYTQWYSYGMMFDIPGRPHTNNHQCIFPDCATAKEKETAPDRIGDLASNLENTRLRYQLIPYTYSLAHRAHRYGEPVMPPPIFYYQTDNNLRNVGKEKMIGSNLLASVIAKHGQTVADVRLPTGTWIDWHTNERYISTSAQSTVNVQAYRDNIFRVPLFATEGAIVPLMHVDENTMNALGKRRDGTLRNELVVKVFAFDGDENDGEATSSFTLYEDDGVTTAYLGGAVAETKISQERITDKITVKLHETVGTYTGAPSSRNNVVQLILDYAGQDVTLNGQSLEKFDSAEALENAASGWFFDCANKTITAKSGSQSVSEAKEFVFTLSEQCERPLCTSRYNSISVPGEGNGWNPADPARMLECEKDKIWKGKIRMSNEAFKFAADGSWKVNWGSDGRQDGPNFSPVQAGDYSITFNEDNPANPEIKPEDGTTTVSAKFICENGNTTFGTSTYVVGNVPALGLWQPVNAQKLEPNGPYPTWTQLIDGLPANTRIEWKCIKRLEGGSQDVIQFEPGDNNVFTTPSTGRAPDQIGTF